VHKEHSLYSSAWPLLVAMADINISDAGSTSKPAAGATGIKIRIHCESHFDEVLIKDVIGIDMFLVKEVGEKGRAHYQGLIYAEPTTDLMKRIRNSVVRRLKLTGNRAYSVSESTDPERYEQYLCKGDDEQSPPVVLLNDRAVDTAAGHAAYWAENARLLKENPMGYKRSIMNMLHSEFPTGKESAQSIYLRAVELHQANNKVISRNRLKDMVFTVRVKDKNKLKSLAITDCAGL